MKGRLSSAVERRTKLRMSGRGETRRDYVVKRSQRLIFSKVVTRGWPLKSKKRVWIVRITYTFPWKTRRITRIADSPTREFESAKDAQEFLGKRLKKGAVQVWVNPKDPGQATVFLDYPSVLTLVLGFAMLGLGLLWLIVALLLKRAHVRQGTV